MNCLKEIDNEISYARSRANTVLAMAELAIIESDLVDEEVESIELELMDSQLELEQAFTTLRIAGLLKD